MKHLACLFLSILLFFEWAHAQTPSIKATQLQEPIQLDGHLHEAFWANSEKAENFLQRVPLEGEAASERTEVSIAYTSTHLYIGAMLFDSDPDGIIGFQKQRDANLHTDDNFLVVLDTFQDGRTGYLFEVNPVGLMGDALISSTVNKSWDGLWEARVQRSALGWSVEMAIPFGTLNFDAEKSTWNINFQRTIRRKNEDVVWNGHRRNQSIFEPIYSGALTGLEGMSQGIGLEIRPYLIGVGNRLASEDNDIDLDSNAGFDIGYSVTPSLRAAFTYNTDFAEVEVDQRRVNLTRFPLLFPEKRDFFLEGSNVFSFAPRNQVTPYFSRNIGLQEGRQIPIAYGVRLGGQQGPFEIGALHVNTKSTAETASENFSIGRIKRNILDQSSLGFVATRRASAILEDKPALPDRYTFGVDIELTTRTLFGDKNFNFQSFIVWNSISVPDEISSDWDRTARGFRFRYDNEPLIFQTSYREFGDFYKPALGFVSRRGFKRAEPQIRYEPLLLENPLIRGLSFSLAFENLLDLDGTRLTRGFKATLLGIEFESGDLIALDGVLSKELLEGDFQIFDDLVVPSGDYDFKELSLSLLSAGRRKLSANGLIERASFWEGTRNQLRIGLNYKPMPGLSLSQSWSVNDVTIPAGSFRTHLFQFSSGWQLNPWQSATTLLQFDNVSELLTLFFRYRWTVKPGSDIYFVLSRNWENAYSEDLDPLDRFRLRAFETGASFKVNYTYRL